jgi:hypothetical protein
LSFESCKNAVAESDRKYQELTKLNMTSASVIFSNKIIFIPILNIIYLPKYFFDKKTVYAVAIAQGIIITALL